MKRTRLLTLLTALTMAMTPFAAGAAPMIANSGPGDPGDIIEAPETSASGNSDSGSIGTKMADSEWWDGYKNTDGSRYKYVERGTEVSKYQNQNGKIDWKAAKADGLDFVMIRLAYGLTEDAYFDENVKGAQKAGIKVGVYLFSIAKNTDQAIAEANLTLKKLKPYNLQYPVAFDVESNIMFQDGAGKDEVTDMINSYCRIMTDNGYTPCVYANRTWLTKHMNLSKIPYDIWYAYYTSDKVYRPVENSNTTMWQSSEKGTVDGIRGAVTTEFSTKAYIKTSGGTKSSIGAGSGSGSSSKTESTKSSTEAGGRESGSTAISEKGPGSAASMPSSQQSGGPGQPPSDGWNKSGDHWYYYKNGKMQIGWQKVNGAWYYLNQDGRMATGWVQDNDVWYWMRAENGDMLSGWLRHNNHWYWFAQDGGMRTGWRQISDKWYYFVPTGEMLENTVQSIDGVSYQFDASGAWVDPAAGAS